MRILKTQKKKTRKIKCFTKNNKSFTPKKETLALSSCQKHFIWVVWMVFECPKIISYQTLFLTAFSVFFRFWFWLSGLWVSAPKKKKITLKGTKKKKRKKKKREMKRKIYAKKAKHVPSFNPMCTNIFIFMYGECAVH